MKKQKIDAKATEKEIKDGVKTLGNEIINIAKDFTTVETNERLSKLDEAKNAELAAAGDNAEKKTEINQRYADQKTAIDKEQGEKQKGISIAQAIVNGALAVTNILATAPKFDGGILTALLIAGAVATTAAQIAVISSQKFERGGMIQGASHAHGGVAASVKGSNARIELEGNEAIMNKVAMMSPQKRSIAGFVNASTGGVDFGSETIPNYLQKAIGMYENGITDGVFKSYQIPKASSLVLMQYNSNATNNELTNKLLSQNNDLQRQNNELTAKIVKNTEAQKTRFRSTF